MFSGQFTPGQPIQFEDAPPRGNPWFRTSMIDIITRQGLTTDLVLCLDPADSNCYGGSGQVLTDLSGQGNDYHLGDSSAGSSNDPTFVGTAGDLSIGTYFSGDGGDFFTPVAATTFDHGWSKDAALLTIVSVDYVVDVVSAAQNIVGNSSGTNAQARFELTTAERLAFQVLDETSAVKLSQVSTAAATTSAWNFLAVSQDENGGAAGLIMQINATQETYNGAYASPTATNPVGELQIWRRSGGNVAQNGSRKGPLAIWNRALSAAELNSLRVALRSRFPAI